MRLSQLFLPTLKEIPVGATLSSHQLMLRAGLIRKLSSGLYTWLPMGLRVLHRIEAVVRQEMLAVGAQEVLMPILQPSALWKETQRWDAFGPLLFKMQDRHQQDFCLGPTHEEVITDLVRGELRSYKQLPVTLFQIQTKFRDEIRPRFGVMRAREFLMKDAYSFHEDMDSLQETYQAMYDAYSRLFTRLGLTFQAVEADTGSIGGHMSHEFQVLADSGEDCIVYSKNKEDPYVKNREVATAYIPTGERPKPENNTRMTMIDTPGLYTIDALCQAHSIPIKNTVKTLVVKGRDTPLVALILRGDHLLNPIHAEKQDDIASPLCMASREEIYEALGCYPGSLGPVNMPLPILVDHDALYISDFVCGANRDNKHYTHVNWGRDLPMPQCASLRFVEEGDTSPSGKSTLHLTRGIEVGHIFQLGKKYSEAMKLQVLDKQGKPKPPHMGCYGIGISRIAAAAIEQHHDANGILWPESIAPFHVIIIPIHHAKSHRVRSFSETLYQALQNADIDVLLDDSQTHPGTQFARADLIGIPHRLVVSEQHIDQHRVEYKHRRSDNRQFLPIDTLLQSPKQVFSSLTSSLR